MVLDVRRKAPVPGVCGGVSVNETGETGATISEVQAYPCARKRFFAFHPLYLLVYLGVLLGLISALALPWVHVKITVLLQFNLDFKLLENGWLTGITVALLVAILLLIHWRRVGGWAAVAGGVGCLAIIGIYAYAMAAKAFHLLGLLKNIPLIGGPLSDFARNMTSVSPAPGFIIFAAGTLLILSGGILLVRRGKRPRAVEELPQVNLS